MQFLDPRKAAHQFGVKDGMHIIELHSGAGHFTPHLSKLVGPYGRVYAFHPSSEALFRSSNVQPIQVHLESDEYIDFPEQVDRVLSANLFSKIDPRIIFTNAYRFLKADGLLIVIEWNKDGAEEEVIHRAGLAGFSRDRRFNAGNHHFGIVFKKV
jgi:cyclopropane fatty-acyl-phospholipid synthase-like methyltransferase